MAILIEMTDEKPLSPGEFIKAELQQRGWTQADFAMIIRRHIPIVSELLQGKRVLTPEMAVAIGIAFGTGPGIWLERENAYRLSLLELDDCEIQRRTRLYEVAPIKDMQKRQWIADTDNPADLEVELCRFFKIQSLDEEPQILASARQTERVEEFTAAQRAWVTKASQLASVLNVRPFHCDKFKAGLSEIRALAQFPEAVRHVPRVLAELGVRLVVVEPLPRSRIDGAAFWLEANAPVIVLSLRYDRIDWFWHTLSHELSHIKNGDKRSVDSDLVGESRCGSFNEIEERADREGAEMLIPQEKLKSFIIRTRPFYSKERINQFAQVVRVHPGIVNGQLQHLKEIGWSHNREMLVKVRDLVIAAAITDGWGRPLPQV
ncbi:MAG: addiction module antidote protein, HigA family [Verrucomicrobiota bacterium]|jgi:HTH-type transcriptional regulator/antitoxin HigA